MRHKILLMALLFTVISSMPVLAGWIQNENSTWSYEQDGELLKKQWFRDQGALYFFDENGIMATGEFVMPSGQVTTFAEDGKWHDDAVRASYNFTKNYASESDNYVIFYPAGAATHACAHKFMISDNASFTIEVTRYANPDGLSLDECADIYSRNMGVTLMGIENIKINQYDFVKYQYSVNHSNGQRQFDAYLYQENGEILFAGAIYHLTAETMVTEIISTIRQQS